MLNFGYTEVVASFDRLRMSGYIFEVAELSGGVAKGHPRERIKG